MRIHLLPIEPFEERYTEQWYRWWKEDLEDQGHEVFIIDGANISVLGQGERESGEWLDTTKTWIYKGRQLENLAWCFYKNIIKDGDLIFSLDMWNPCLTGALYMRDTTKKKVKIAAFYHAGASDPNDFLARSGCRKWGLDIERGWVRGLDYIFCGTKFAAMMLKKNLSLWQNDGAKIYATGYPIKFNEIRSQVDVVKWSDRERLVVFPHRLAPEKQPYLFKRLRSTYRRKYGDDGTKFIRTRDVCSSKKEYYQLLAKSRVSVSFAKQETFGIAQQEAFVLGAKLLNPNCLSYTELTDVNKGLLYEPYDIEDACVKLKQLLDYDYCRDLSEQENFYNETAIKRVSDILKGISNTVNTDYKDETFLPSQYDFWAGKYQGQKCLFINNIPTDLKGRIMFSQEKLDSYDCIYFTGAYDLSILEQKSYLVTQINKRNVIIARNYGTHTDLNWIDIFEEHKGKMKVVYKIHESSDFDGIIEVGEPFTSKHYKLTDKEDMYEYDRKW